MDKAEQNIIVVPSLAMVFNARSWDANDWVRNANCYTYALNAPELGGRDPGKAKAPERKIMGNPRNMVNVEFLRQLVLDDGLIPATEKDFDPKKNHIVALFGGVSYNFFLGEKTGNYHFMRLDHDGTWSEKPGHTPAKNMDMDGKPLTTSNLHGHFIACSNAVPDQELVKSVFAGYHRVPESGISFKPKAAS